MNRMIVVTSAGVLLGFVSWLTGQEEPASVTGRTKSVQGLPASDALIDGAIASGGVLVAPTSGSTVATWQANPLSEEQDQQMKELAHLREVVQEIRENTSLSEEALNGLRSEAKAILAQQIDRDIEQRQAKLAEIEKRAAELKKQLAIRQQNKEKTIEMLLMLAENPGTGLGIPNEWLQSLTLSGQPARYVALALQPVQAVVASGVLLATPTPMPQRQLLPQMTGAMLRLPADSDSSWAGLSVGYCRLDGLLLQL